jgi:hypothetical protein
MEYLSIRFYSIYRPPPGMVEMDWDEWLAGVEFVNGKPYVFSLVHFQWEP